MGELKKNKGQRVEWVDVAKCIGILAIVYGHAVQGGATNRYVYSFHVPLFFLLLGVVFGITRAERTPLRAFVKRKAYTLLVPYYCFAIISTGMIFVASRFVPMTDEDIFSNLPRLIFNVIIGNCDANRPLWFLPCAFVISLMAYGVIRLSNCMKKRTHKLWVYVAFVAVGCVALYVVETFTTVKFLPYKLDGAVFMIPFFLAGHALQEFSCFEKIARWPLYIRILVTAALLLLGGAVGLLNGRSIYLGNYYDNVWAMYLAALATGIGICLLSQMLPTWSISTYVGKHTLGIVLMHKFPVLVFQVVVPFTAPWLAQDSMPMGLLVTVISVALCCVVELGIIRICPFMLGATFKKKTTCQKGVQG